MISDRAIAGERESMTNLVNEYSHHVLLRHLQRPEYSTEVELDIILLSLHADPHKHSSLRVQIHP